MSLCHACGKRPVVFHITLNLSVFGPTTTRLKAVQVELCDSCKVGLQQVYFRDDYIKPRIAARLSDAPEYKCSVPVAWKHRDRNYNPVE